MPGKNISSAAPLSSAEIKLRDELIADVQTLAGQIGERNMVRYLQLNAAADFIENSFSRAGLQPRRDSYDLRGRAFHNIEAEIPGRPQGAAAPRPPPSIILIGAHYDSVFGSPGANDNGSGVAALLALARRFAGKPTQHALRFVAFVNEEPPIFLTEQMGSFVYASRCKARGDKISAMISIFLTHRIRNRIRPQGWACFIQRLATSLASSATFRHVTCSVRPSPSFENTQKFHLKGRRCQDSFPV